ncbi:hypothetical protein N5923_19670 [Erwiniaceae bacterium BAC15a-03b]|uniref:DUF2946 domain-containing protein n=1 Tax=Winslowiella arboricola TaxID=2978220 RepID=A0A9J6Q0C8_9GAMM|nr:hypothetical protein [Winslowiella arboricola]MCU5775439.1 hypothetical protein [Winslowiella arboricola]MCU5779711.1 hypothetical protein [Winslowiella arboricola]
MFRRLINIGISLIRRKQRRLILLCVSCWLFFSAQLALASHECSLAFSCMPGASQQHSQQMLAQASLCDKHCAPDPLQDDHASLHVVAIAADPGLRLAVSDVVAKKFHFDWLRPPVTGPPAEIRFCRFRE